MTVPLYAFEIIPGSQQSFGFSLSLDEAVREATDLRRELTRENPQFECRASSIYEYRLRKITPQQIVSILNRRESLGQLVLGERRLVHVIEGSTNLGSPFVLM